MSMKEKLFALVGFSTQRHSLKTEVVSGLTTFITMSYILALLPAMFAPLISRGFPVNSLFTAIALATIVGTLLMAFLAKRPFGQAPGLTLNVFFIETVCIFEMVPTSLKHAIAVGIGFFIAMIGFKNSGILAEGTIFNHLETLATPSSILFVIGIVLTGIFTVMHFKGGLLLSIVITTLIGIPMGVTTIPDYLFDLPTSPAPLFCQFSWDYLLTPDLWVCVLTMLFFDVFDSLGTIVGVMANSGLIRKNGRIPYMQKIMLSDALGTVAGACLGCSTVTTYVESATGVAEGGRTGLTALVIALCFVASLFLAPLFLAIPAAATAPVMIMAGFYLFGSVSHINLSKPAETMPAFLTILLMPVTGSITDGIIAGLFTYIVFSFIDGLVNRKKKDSLDIED